MITRLPPRCFVTPYSCRRGGGFGLTPQQHRVRVRRARLPSRRTTAGDNRACLGKTPRTSQALTVHDRPDTPPPRRPLPPPHPHPTPPPPPSPSPTPRPPPPPDLFSP